MNEEEKNAIEEFRKQLRLAINIDDVTTAIRNDNAQTILNLIEKLQKENEELKEYKKIAELTKISCCTAQNCEALNNSIKSELENQKLKEELNDINQKWIQKVKDKIEKEIKYHEKNILDIENITMLKSKTAKEEAKIEFNKYVIVVLKKMLQELLEGRK